MSTPIRKRNRRIISCLNCRKRKRKCDRELPCLNCKRYNIASTCTYDLSVPAGVKKATSSSSAAPAMQHELVVMKDRLSQIEASIAVATLHRATVGPNDIPEDGSMDGSAGGTQTSLGNNEHGSVKDDVSLTSMMSGSLESLNQQLMAGNSQPLVPCSKSHKYLISHISPPSLVPDESDVINNREKDLSMQSVDRQPSSQFVTALPSGSPFIPNLPIQQNQSRFPSQNSGKQVQSCGLPALPSLIVHRSNDNHSVRNGLSSHSSATNIQRSLPSSSSNILSAQVGESSLSLGSRMVASINLVSQNMGNIFVGPYPLESAEEEMSFHSSPPKDYKEVLAPPRTLHFKSLLRFDPGIQFFWKYRPFLKPDSLIREKMIYISEEKIEHYTLEAKRIYAEGYIPRPEETNDAVKIKLAITKFACRVGLNFAPNIDYSVNLVTRIKLMLSGIEIMPYVNKFFKNLYTYFPVIEQEEFTRDLSRILGEELAPTTTCQNLRFEKRDDIATVAILLIMVRWVSISDIQFMYDSQSYLLVPTDESSRFGVLPIEFVDLAEDCVKELNVVRYFSIRILQCLLFIRTYRMHSPEEADGTSGSSTQVFNGIVINMAFSLGLNRDPSKVANYDLDPKMRYQQKKLWFHVSKLDLLDSMMYGSMISTSDETYDLVDVTNNDYSGSMKNFHIEKTVIELGMEFNQICRPLKKIVKLIIDLRNPVKLSLLLEEVTKLEVCMKHVLGDFSRYLDPNYFIQKLIKAWKFVVYVHCQMTLCYVYHVLFLHYERKGNYQLMLFYFNKYISMVIAEWAELTPEILAKAFDGTGWLLIAPVVQLLYQMLLLVCNTAMLRLSAGLYRMEVENIDDPVRKDALCDLRNIVEDTSMSKLKGLYSLRNRYSMAWKLSKVHFGVFHVLKNWNCLDRAVEDGFLRELEFGLVTSDIQNTTSLLTMYRTKPLLTVEGLVTALRNRPDKCLAESIQIDNMWIHMANFFHEPDAVPPMCQNDGSAGLGLEPTSYSIFPTDFEAFGNLLLFQI